MHVTCPKFPVGLTAIPLYMVYFYRYSAKTLSEYTMIQIEHIQEYAKYKLMKLSINSMACCFYDSVHV